MKHLKVLSLIAALALAATSVLAQDTSKNILRVRLDGLRSNQGKAHCTLFDAHDPAAFPSHGDKALKEGDSAPLQNKAVEIDFTAIAPGKYALVCFHDENNNGKFDENMLGMPKEGYSFSNNIKPKVSAPTFAQCAFDYRGGDQSIPITMIYLF